MGIQRGCHGGHDLLGNRTAEPRSGDARGTIPARHRPRKQAPRARCLSPCRCNRYIDTIQAASTASDIKGITLREASDKVGVTRQTLLKAIKKGRVSAEKSDNGKWRNEPVTRENA